MHSKLIELINGLLSHGFSNNQDDLYWVTLFHLHRWQKWVVSFHNSSHIPQCTGVQCSASRCTAQAFKCAFNKSYPSFLKSLEDIRMVSNNVVLMVACYAQGDVHIHQRIMWSCTTGILFWGRQISLLNLSLIQRGSKPILVLTVFGCCQQIQY